MDDPWLATHLDPIAKIKLGWALPYVITASGNYQLRAIERAGRLGVDG